MGEISIDIMLGTLKLHFHEFISPWFKEKATMLWTIRMHIGISLKYEKENHKIPQPKKQNVQ